MPYRLVRMYVEQMAATKAEYKLEQVEIMMTANADKKADRDRILNEWRRIADKGRPVSRENLNGTPTGMGVK